MIKEIKKVAVVAIALIAFSLPAVSANAQQVTDEQRLMIVQSLIQKLLLIQEELLTKLSNDGVSVSSFEIIYDDTLTMPGYSGSGFFDGESFIVQEITLRNSSAAAVKFDAGGLRLRDEDGTLFFPVHVSAVAGQPRFQSSLTNLPTDRPDVRSVTIFPDEEIKVAASFYINQVPADDIYSIRYQGGDPVNLTVDN